MKTNVIENLQKVKSIIRYLIERNVKDDLNSIANFMIANKTDVQGKELVAMTALLAINDAKKGIATSKNESYMLLYNIAKEVLAENNGG
jgi:porphobilinogen deaminase